MAVPDVDPLKRIDRYTRVYRRPLGFPTRLGFIGSVLLVVFALTFLARLGTDVARALSGLGIVVSVAVAIFVSRALKRKWREPGSALFHALRRWNESEAARARRALSTFTRLRSLRENGQTGGESEALAALHLNRVLDSVPVAEVGATGVRTRRLALRWVLPVLLACVAVLALRPLMILEGVDVLLARKGVGPFPIAYVSGLSITAELPTYLDGTGRRRPVTSRLTSVPQGSEIEVRAIPQVAGRRLLLTDGVKEVPLVSDGQGGLVGRWRAEDASLLRVAARFGDVLLLDGQGTLLSPLEDRAPKVKLAGAPARRKLEQLDALDLKYIATDDHGITQVDLVIESGQRVHREELAHLDGQEKTYRGAHRVPGDHDMLRKAFLPVRVRIEARDGNTATGPNWGRSESFTLLPEPLGKHIAERHRQLRDFRAALTTYLASDLKASHLSAFEAQEARDKAREVLRAGYEHLKQQLSQSVDVPRNSLAFFEAQLEALTRKGAERSSSEAVVLATDSLIQNIATKEAKSLSRDLGSAVEELAVQAREIRFNAEGIRREGLMDLVSGVTEGAAQLREVGILGLDLGSVAEADLARISASLKKKEYGRAEVAALHLAERLKRATPSFGSKGGAVESGTPQSGGSGEAGEGPPSDAPDRFSDLSSEVDSLAQETATELSELERMLREARRAAEADFEPSDALKETAENLRRALRQLPSHATAPGGPRSEAASARGHGEAMAEALDAQDLLEAIERGVDAEEALQRAQKMLQEQQGWMDGESLSGAEKALKEALAEARSAAEDLKQRQAGEIGSSLSERAERQREFAERAQELAKKGREPEAPLPSESIEALQRAARLLKQAAQEMDAGRGEAGAEYSAEAQSQLERALPEPSEGSSRPSGPEGDSDSMSREGSVPEAEKDRARDFRERVEKGLGRGAGHLSPAVRRYAEELK